MKKIPTRKEGKGFDKPKERKNDLLNKRKFASQKKQRYTCLTLF